VTVFKNQYFLNKIFRPLAVLRIEASDSLLQACQIKILKIYFLGNSNFKIFTGIKGSVTPSKIFFVVVVVFLVFLFLPQKLTEL
jgi:hypothetical protein